MQRFNGVIDDSFYIDGGRKIETVNDIQVLDLKNRLLVETLPIEIINWASHDGRSDIVQAVASMLGINQYSSYYINEPKLAESHAGLYYRSAVLCGHGHDLANGVDVKTGSLKEGDTGCAIGNTKNKSLLHVYICDTFRWKVTMTIKPIPVPGSEDSIIIPITPEGKVWDEYEFADCFKKEDVGTQPDRHVTGIYARHNILKLTRASDPFMRVRVGASNKNLLQKAFEGEADIVYYFNDDDNYPIYLYTLYDDTLKLNSSISLQEGFVSSRKYNELFPRFIVKNSYDKTRSIRYNAQWLHGGPMDERNIETLEKMIEAGFIK